MMFRLQLATDPRWANLAETSLEEILVDHAFCEQKAATTCISLIIRYPEHDKLVDVLSPIVAEEWGHFRRVIKEIRKRGFSLGYPRKDEYVNQLLGFQKRGLSREFTLMDGLLTSAMIEARSCERFRVLSEGLDDEYLRGFYREFMESEAGHYTVFMELARTYQPEETVNARWREWLDFETHIITNLAPRPDRVH
jgi:tRNA 2-(methylsulfanyl)-N6-isopentenyladenosine37 hydroxylase